MSRLDKRLCKGNLLACAPSARLGQSLSYVIFSVTYPPDCARMVVHFRTPRGRSFPSAFDVAWAQGLERGHDPMTKTAKARQRQGACSYSQVTRFASRPYGGNRFQRSEQFTCLTLHSRTHAQSHLQGRSRVQLSAQFPGAFSPRPAHLHRRRHRRGNRRCSTAQRHQRYRNFPTQEQFLLLTVAHRHDDKLMRSYSQLLLTRGVEGIITIDTSVDQQPTVPTVAIAGHQHVPNVTNIILDHHHAARLVLQHLLDLGHRHIAFFRGPSSSSDSVPAGTPSRESPPK